MILTLTTAAIIPNIQTGVVASHRASKRKRILIHLASFIKMYWHQSISIGKHATCHSSVHSLRYKSHYIPQSPTQHIVSKISAVSLDQTTKIWLFTILWSIVMSQSLLCSMHVVTGPKLFVVFEQRLHDGVYSIEVKRIQFSVVEI